MKHYISSIKNTIIVVMLTGLLLIPQMAFASMNIADVTSCYFIKTSDNEAEAYIYATYLSPRNVVLKMSLEEAPEGTTNYSLVDGPYTQYFSNTRYVYGLESFEYDEDCECRVKFELTDTLDGVQTSVIRYATLQDGDQL